MSDFIDLKTNMSRRRSKKDNKSDDEDEKPKIYIAHSALET